MLYWCIRDGGVYPVDVKPIIQQGKTVYRNSLGMTYSARHIRTWPELTKEQQIKAYRNAYQAKREAALFQIAKENELYSQYPAWIEQLKSERDNAISAIERGESIDPPRMIWA